MIPEPRQLRAEMIKRDYHGAASFLEDRFSRYVGLKTDTPPGPLAARYDHDRHMFASKFPALTVEEVSGATYEGQTQASHLPGFMPFALRIYAPSLKGRLTEGGFQPNQGARDARGEAKNLTRSVYALWYEAFRKDAKNLGAQRVWVTSIEIGDADALGNPMIDETGTNMLFVFRANVMVQF